jgi:hypothetical protein
MDQQPGQDLRSGREETKTKAKKKRKRKPNGKTDWKGLCRELSEKLEKLTEQNNCLSQENLRMTEELDNDYRIIQSLRQDLTAHRKSAMGEREKIALRNLRHFHGRVVNTQYHCDEDKKKMDKLAAETSRFIRKKSSKKR